MLAANTLNKQPQRTCLPILLAMQLPPKPAAPFCMAPTRGSTDLGEYSGLDCLINSSCCTAVPRAAVAAAAAAVGKPAGVMPARSTAGRATEAVPVTDIGGGPASSRRCGRRSCSHCAPLTGIARAGRGS